MKKAIPRLADIAPDLEVPQFASDEYELKWLEKNHQLLAELAEKQSLEEEIVNA